MKKKKQKNVNKRRETTILIEWKIQHSKNVNSLKTNIQVTTFPIKISARNFLDMDKIIVKFV